jgi:Na+/melibiose symporter-like transporter
MKNWTDPGAMNWQEAIIQQARYAYLTVGFLIFPSSVLFTAVYLYSCSPLLLPRKSESVSMDETTSDDCKTTSSISEVDQRRMLRFVFLFLLFIVCLLNACCENIPEAYMTMFVIKHLGWPVQRGTLIMSVFYGTQSAGCLVGVGLSTVVRPRTMIVFNLCISIIAYLLLLCAPMQDAVVLVSVALAGYGTSSTFAAIVLWVSESVQVSGGVSATLMIGGALGDMTGPLIIGQLFESYSPLWLIYSQIMITLAMLLLFVLLLLFIHRNKKFINLDTPLAPTNLDTPLAPRTKN